MWSLCYANRIIVVPHFEEGVHQGAGAWVDRRLIDNCAFSSYPRRGVKTGELVLTEKV
jgi:hypothetical protein